MTNKINPFLVDIKQIPDSEDEIQLRETIRFLAERSTTTAGYTAISEAARFIYMNKMAGEIHNSVNAQHLENQISTCLREYVAMGGHEPPIRKTNHGAGLYASAVLREQYEMSERLKKS